MLALCSSSYMLIYDTLHQGSKTNERSRTKRNSSKTRKKPLRHDNPRTPHKTKHARLPAHHHHPQRIWGILWPQHDVPSTRVIGKERLSQKHLEHDRRAPKKSLHHNRARQKPPSNNRELSTIDLSENKP